MRLNILWIFTLVTVIMPLGLSSCTPSDPTLEKRDCVVMLGDSIFALSGKETDYLEQLSGHKYREYYISGAQMIDGGITTIPEQYKQARRNNPNIRTVIADGGDNDIFLGGQAACSTKYGSPLSYECIRLLAKIRTTFWETAENMVADGIENIVWQGYYYMDNERLWQVFEVYNQMMINTFEAFGAEHSQVNLVYVNVLPHFDKEVIAVTTIDGIHPTDAASKKMAELLWGAMVANGIEQGGPCPPESVAPGCR